MIRFIKYLGNALFIGTLIYFVFLAIFLFMGEFDGGFSFRRAFQEYYANMIFAVILYMVNAYWIHYLIVKYEHRIYSGKRLLMGISGNILLSLVGIFVSRLILKVGIENMSISNFLVNEKLGHYKVSLLLAILISAIFYLAWYFKYRQENKVK